MLEMQKKLMIVDDDPSILITIRELFESEGYHVYTVTNGKECIDELKSGFKGVILMDIMMPLMDGWETIREMMKHNLIEGNTISILTAKEYHGQNLQEFEGIVKDYITKPFTTKELINTVNSYFQKF